MGTVVERRLTAILYADVAGYSRLTGVDEAGTHQALKVHLGAFSEAIEGHGGRICHFAGDAVLAEFSSVVTALECAIIAQRGLAERNQAVPDDRKLQFRVGVNLGDVIVDGDEIYGNGVNVAARLEAQAEPGGICVSDRVLEQVRGNVDAGFSFMGPQTVKNIETPVNVYKVLLDPADAGKIIEAPIRRKSRWWRWVAVMTALAIAVGIGGVVSWFQFGKPNITRVMVEDTTQPVTEIPSIAVLPFDNFSNDKSQEYFSDGLAEDLITAISKVSGLSVIARNSTFSFKGGSPDVREVGKSLGASHVVEGSVRKSGGKVRISVQLVNAANGQHLWAERYDRDLQDVFAIQDEVVGHIIKALALKLTPQERDRLATRGTSNLEAFDLYMKGLQQESFFNEDALIKAQAYFEQSIALDPDYAESYAHLAQVFGLRAEFKMIENVDQAYEKALALAEKAVQLNPDLPFARWSLARILSRPAFRQFDRAIMEAEKAIVIDPNYADAYASLGIYYAFTGQAERTADYVKKAMRVNPIYPFWYHQALGVAHFMLEDYEAAVREIRIALERNPSFVIARHWLIAALAMADRVDDAEWEIDELAASGALLTLQEMMDQALVVHPEYRERYLEGLRKAGFN